MKKTLVTLAMMLVTFTANAQTYTYDVNNDGEINITDVGFLVNKIFGTLNPEEDIPQAYLTCPDDLHPHLIDLGLSSGTLWACCNVDANTPEEYGGYYAWGETEEKDYYGWNNYILSGESYDTVFGDGDDIAGTEFDVAYVKWGDVWQMPTAKERDELLGNCAMEWTELNNVKGGKFTGVNGGSIFLPAGGYFSYNKLSDVGSYGNYWTSTPNISEESSAYRIPFFYGGVGWYYDNECTSFTGINIRPVSKYSQTYCYDINGDGNISIVDVTCLVNMILGAPNPGEEELQAFLTCPDDNHPHIIDLGLPSGTKWSCCNVGANSPESHGGYYAWGETEEKEVYNHVTYLYSTGMDSDEDGYYNNMNGENGTYAIWQFLGGDIAGTLYDVAHIQGFGIGKGRWRMPTSEQIKELIDNSSYTWTTKNGFYGGQFKGPSGGVIFLPAAGFRSGDYLSNSDKSGWYWSSTPWPVFLHKAIFFSFGSNNVSMSNGNRSEGRTVRPVAQ